MRKTFAYRVRYGIRDEDFTLVVHAWNLDDAWYLACLEVARRNISSVTII